METYPIIDSTTGKAMPNCSRPIDYGVKANNISFISDSGLEQVRPRGKVKQTFSFTYVALTLSQYKTLRNFFIARKGSFESFLWTDPVEKVQYTVRFKMEEFMGKNIAHNSAGPLYSLEIKLEEVL